MKFTSTSDIYSTARLTNNGGECFDKSLLNNVLKTCHPDLYRGAVESVELHGRQMTAKTALIDDE